jgi:RHS repeat-associated protein
LPQGQTETYSYDANGNLTSHVDFNAHTTSYSYDALNHLLNKAADTYFVQNHIGAPAISFTYTATGKRASMTDASGTTTYQYDNLDRLISEATPEGTLTYTYDAAGDVTGLHSSNTNGASLTYGYDALNRLASASDASGTSDYTYDDVGNLQSVTYPNGVTHSYNYDTRNRLTSLAVAKSTQLAAYNYTLDAAGHRLSVAEASGRTVNYAYDNIYRLTSETIAADPNGVNGAVNYTLDAVGNRTQRTSTLAPIAASSSTFSANDQLTTDAYDANGNTTGSGGSSYVYDFENHLLQKGGVTIVYDGDGNRVSKTAGGVTTQYLVDHLNPSTYTQVVDEVQAGVVTKTYTWGLQLIAETRLQPSPNPALVSYYVFDGLGSVRALASPAGTLTDTYDFDAFGNLIHSSGTTPNNYLFAGEQYDPDLGLYYNRARYLNASTGRFLTMDTLEPNISDPSSLHRYLYVMGDPVNSVDPTGMAYTQQFGYDVEDVVEAAYAGDFGANALVSFGRWTRLGGPGSGAYRLKPDILDLRPFRGDGSPGMVWLEIKPLSLSGLIRAAASYALYTAEFTSFGINPDPTWLSAGRLFSVPSGGMSYATLVFNVGGILFYTTTQSDYDYFADLLTAGAFGAAAGAVAGALSRSLPATLPSTAPVSEVEEIQNLIRFAVEADELEEEVDVGLDLAA